MTYASFLAALFVLWPVAAVLGGQGFAPIAGVAALGALALARPRMPPAGFAFVGFSFVAWAALSEVWAAGGGGIVSGSLVEGTFSVEASSLSAALLTLASAFTIAGARRTAPAPRASMVVAGMLCVQCVFVIVSPFAADWALSAVYGEDLAERNKGVQNMLRNANTMALALPLLLPFLVFRAKIAGAVLALLLLLGGLATYVQLGSDSALMALVGMGLGMGLVAALPQTGFRWLFGGIAGYLAAAPVLFAFVIRALDPVAQNLPASFRSRLWSWEAVIGRMTEAPFVGHGMNDTETWTETFATRPDWLAQVPDFWETYQIVPGHPHNMPLQLWAETGMIGAVLAALCVVALAFHLPRPKDLRPEVRLAIAGLAGAAVPICSFAYSLWNDGFWASIALAAAAIILWHRTYREARA